MSEKLPNKIYMINRGSSYFLAKHRGYKIQFLYNVPVLVDYSKDTQILKYLTQFPQIEVCTSEEAERLLTKVEASVPVEESETVQSNSVTEKLLESEDK